MFAIASSLVAIPIALIVLLVVVTVVIVVVIVVVRLTGEGINKIFKFREDFGGIG